MKYCNSKGLKGLCWGHDVKLILDQKQVDTSINQKVQITCQFQFPTYIGIIMITVSCYCVKSMQVRHGNNELVQSSKYVYYKEQNKMVAL